MAESLFARMSALAKESKPKMKTFVLIDDGVAIVRKPKGVMIQTKLYHRDGRIYVNAAGGFIRVCDKFDETYSTSHSDFKVVDLEGTNVKIDGKKAPTLQAWGK